jgi:aminopeptidase N
MKIGPNTSAYAAQMKNSVAPNLEIKKDEGGKIDASNKTVQEKSSALAAHEKQETARTLFYVQKIASVENTDDTEKGTAVQDFLEYMDKSTAEKWREQILNSMGLTEESLEAMSAKDRQKVEEKIAQIIEEKIEEDARENNQNGAVQKLQASIDDHGIDPSQLSLTDKEQLSKLSDNVLQMIDLPEEVESLYKQQMSEMNNRSEENEGKKQGG